tara:strand:+ start:81 stop:302 length:222 start_codon:yes stop_codon:yes gene_type:complete
MKVNNMKELLEYVANKQKKQSHQHYEVAKLHGPCSGMGNRRYKIPQKSTFSKFKKYSYTARWNDYKLNTNKVR